MGTVSQYVKNNGRLHFVRLTLTIKNAIIRKKDVSCIFLEPNSYGRHCSLLTPTLFLSTLFLPSNCEDCEVQCYSRVNKTFPRSNIHSRQGLYVTLSILFFNFTLIEIFQYIQLKRQLTHQFGLLLAQLIDLVELTTAFSWLNNWLFC